MDKISHSRVILPESLVTPGISPKPYVHALQFFSGNLGRNLKTFFFCFFFGFQLKIQGDLA